MMFTATTENPYHLAVGAILLAPQGCYVVHKKDGIYSMMTGTLEPSETPAACLDRELMEEMGAMCDINGYAGTTLHQVADHRGTWTKATIWMRCTLSAIGFERTHDLDKEVVALGREVVRSRAGVKVDPSRWPTGLLAADDGGGR